MCSAAVPPPRPGSSAYESSTGSAMSCMAPAPVDASLPNTFHALPSEIIERILTFCDPRDVSVCQHCPQRRPPS